LRSARLIVIALVAAAGLWLAPAGAAAGWCGSGESATERPDIVAGPQVHAIYVLPADGADNFAQVAGAMADDTASIDAWWRTQDATRTVRFDLAAFPGCTGLDISVVRLAETGAALQGDVPRAFRAVAGELASSLGFGSDWKRYLVYYDGPPPQANVCGTGAGDFGEGPGVAVVWLGGCAGVPTDSIAAHELLHSLGALPDGAPHVCPTAAGHPCDSPTDVLYPTTSGAPLASEVLDFGHDDYYAHSGSWNDIQDSFWLHRLDLPPIVLTLSDQGAGTVTSDLPGGNCAAPSCVSQWDPGSHVTFNAVPGPGTRFVGWRGGCRSADNCSVLLNAPASLTAVFGPLEVPVRVSTTGRGRVVCVPGCSKSFTAGSPLYVRALPAKGWVFRGWSGACTGRRLVCTPATDFAVAVRATFKKAR
jgi:hypothetical protein